MFSIIIFYVISSSIIISVSDIKSGYYLLPEAGNKYIKYDVSGSKL